MQIGRLEQQRGETIDKIARMFKVDKKELTLSNIMNLLGDEEQQRIKEYGEKMMNTLEQLKEVNDLNSKLIKQALEYVNFSLNLITSASVPGNTYENKGNIKGAKSEKNLFDVKL